MIRIDDNLTKLEKTQMDTINKLQEKIRLLEFDNAQNNNLIREYKRILLYKKFTINEVIKKLNNMKKENDYSNLNYIISSLDLISKKGIDNE